MAGHIEERGKDRHGRDVFRVFVSGGFDGNGKRIRKTFTVHGTMREAERALKQTELELEDGTTSSTMKFADWVHQWLKATDRSRAPRTVAEYARMLASRILPALGGYRLDQIKPRHIAEFMTKLAGATHAKRKGCNLTGNTQLKYFRLISVIFQDAVYLGMLPTNPARQVRPPRHERRSARFYDPQDVARLWQSLQGEPLMWQAIIATCLLLGVRRGELMGLRWGDINWARGVIRIERAAYRVSRGEQQVKAPKTATSVRAILMPSPLVAILREWQTAQGGGPQDYICTDANRRWLHIDAPTKWFVEFTRRHQLPALSLHGLRHTAATIMVEAGVPLRAVSEHLGHGQVSTTANIYVHTTQASRERAAEALANALIKMPK